MMNKFETLAKRSLTALIFGVIVIILLNYNYFTVSIFLLLVGFLTSIEFYKIKGLFDKKNLPITISAIATGILPGMFQIFYNVINEKWFIFLLVFIIIYSLIKIADLFYNFKNEVSNNITILGEGMLYIGLPLRLLLYLIRPEDFILHKLIFILILMIWANDTFAYLTGTMFGKRKLMPSVSPKKSLEGFIGGLILTLVTSYILFIIYDIFDITFFFLLALVVSIIGTFGDLVESRLKRLYNLKDSGNMLPGHGGFLDRFDSFIFVLPYFILLLLYYLN